MDYEESVETTGMDKLAGSVLYRERVMLPPDADITVSLEDVSKQDVAAGIIATTRLSPAGGPPWDFVLEFDPDRIDSGHRYVLRARIEVNGQLMFTNTEQIPVISKTEDRPLEILVSRVGHGRGAQPSTPPVPDVSLVNTYWKLSELNGQPAALGAGGRELHMVLSDRYQVRGFSGCNRFTGNYDLTKNQLSFRPLAATRMACAEGMEQEQRFLDLLAEVMRFTISGDSLALYSGDEQLILRFQAVALR